MKPLIDCDVLRYEIGFSGQFKEGDELIVRPFEFVAELFDEKVRQICDAVWATEPPTLYLTGKGNFRDEIATIKPYKGTRKSEKTVPLLQPHCVYPCSLRRCCSAWDGS